MKPRDRMPGQSSLTGFVERLIFMLVIMSIGAASFLLADQLIDYTMQPDTWKLRLPSILFGVVGVLCLAAGLHTALTARKKIFEPLKRLSMSIQALKEADFSYRAETGPAFSEIEELSAALASMAQTMEDKNVMRQKLLSGLAHELFTPLTALRGNLEAIQEGVFQADEKLELLIGQALSMQQLIKDFRDLAMAEDGVLPLRKEEIDPVPLVERVLQGLEPLFGEKKITLHPELVKGAPCMIDRERFIQAISRLLGTVLDYTPSGGRVAVRCDKESRHGHSCLSFSVEDSGPEIEKEQIPHVFVHFYGEKKFRSTVIGKNHITLALVRSIAEAHGGSAEVGVTPGRGNTYTLLFPEKTGES